MKNMKQLLSGMLAMLTVLMMAGCMGDADPVRVSLDIDASDLVLNIGETSTRVGSSKAADSHFTYRTDKSARLPSPYTWMRTAPTGMRRQTAATG